MTIGFDGLSIPAVSTVNVLAVGNLIADPQHALSIRNLNRATCSDNYSTCGFDYKSSVSFRKNLTPQFSVLELQTWQDFTFSLAPPSHYLTFALFAALSTS